MSSYYVRTDSSTANNAEINLTGTPTFEITFVAETQSSAPGDLILAGGPDPDTQVEIGGQTYSFSVDWVGTLPSANNQGGNKVPSQFQGDVVMRIAVQDYPAAGEVTHLVFMPYEDATAAEMASFGTGRINVINLTENPEPVPVCYVVGTRLETVNGLIPVENLRTGDLLITGDSGPQPICWIGWTEHRWPGADEKLRPVRIPAGCLNGQAPYHDLLVSPQHRILLSKECFAFMDEQEELFAPALSLEGNRGIMRQAACKTVRYYHVLLAHHSVLRAEGVPSESFFPGPIALRNLGLGHRIQIMTLFPDLAKDPKSGYGPLCRTALTKRQAIERLAAGVEKADPYSTS
jgi:hypothetical protein